MMKANELRIGNWVENAVHGMGQVEYIDVKCNSRATVIGIKGKGFRMSSPNPDTFTPIPLTEQWLVRFGFEKKNDDQHAIRVTHGKITIEIVVFSDFGIGLYYVHYKEFPRDERMVPILGGNNQHVHQLQNLFFSLTGTELELKS